MITKNNFILWVTIPFLIFIGFIILFLGCLKLQESATVYLLNKDQALPNFQLSTLNSCALFTPKMMKGKAVLLNVWASWCISCEEEHLLLMKLARQGIPIYGLNYKDNLHDAKNWLAEWGNPYRAVGLDTQGLVGIDLGVYKTPETFLIDPQGIILAHHVGILNENAWEKLRPLLEPV